MQFLRRALLGIVLATVTSSSSWAADDWPKRPLRVMVPYPAGGAADLLGRLVARKISIGVPNSTVVVENVSGGATVLAAQTVLRDPADGHALFMASDNTLNINRWLLKSPPYDGDRDFVPITVLNTYPHWLIVNPTGKHKDFAGFLEYIRANPGKASISVNTVGGSAFLALDRWKRENKLDFEIIPYRGSPPAVADLIGNQTDAHVDVVGSSASYARSGKLLPIAVLQSAPLAEFPQALPQREDDPKALTVRANLSVVMKSGTPQAVIDRLYAVLQEGVKQPDFVQALETLNFSPVLMPPDQARQFLRDETARYRDLVEQSGLEKQ